MSNHSSEGITDKRRQARLDELADDRAASSGGWSDLRTREAPAPEAATNEAPRVGVIDPDREQLGDGSWPTDEEREVGKPGLDKARRVLAETSERLGVDAVNAATLAERSSAERPDENLAELRARARQLAIETGVTHRIVRDAFGRLTVEMVPPRAKPIGKTKRSTW